MALGDRVERTADQHALVGRHRLARAERRPEIARDADHLGADGRELPAGAILERVGRQLHLERVPELRRKERLAQAPLALGAREDDVTKVAGKSIQRGLRGSDGGLQARSNGGQLALLVGVRRGREGRPAQLADAGQLGQRDLGVEAADRAVRRSHEARAGR